MHRNQPLSETAGTNWWAAARTRAREKKSSKKKKEKETEKKMEEKKRETPPFASTLLFFFGFSFFFTAAEADGVGGGPVAPGVRNCDDCALPGLAEHGQIYCLVYFFFGSFLSPLCIECCQKQETRRILTKHGWVDCNSCKACGEIQSFSFLRKRLYSMRQVPWFYWLPLHLIALVLFVSVAPLAISSSRFHRNCVTASISLVKLICYFFFQSWQLQSVGVGFSIKI